MRIDGALRLGLLLGWLVLAGAGPAWAAPIVLHDESSDGDLSQNIFDPDFGLLGGGDYRVLGSLDGGPLTGGVGPDEFDAFQFSASGEWSLDLVALGERTVAIFLAGDANLADTLAAPGPVFGPLAAGDYFVTLAPLGNVGTTSYEISITVPEPSAIALFALLAAGLVGARRR